jgi:hypothetical protein
VDGSYPTQQNIHRSLQNEISHSSYYTDNTLGTFILGMPLPISPNKACVQMLPELRLKLSHWSVGD